LWGWRIFGVSALETIPAGFIEEVTPGPAEVAA
jgi:hypothetical protein